MAPSPHHGQRLVVGRERGCDGVEVEVDEVGHLPAVGLVVAAEVDEHEDVGGRRDDRGRVLDPGVPAAEGRRTLPVGADRDRPDPVPAQLHTLGLEFPIDETHGRRPDLLPRRRRPDAHVPALRAHGDDPVAARVCADETGPARLALSPAQLGEAELLLLLWRWPSLHAPDTDEVAAVTEQHRVVGEPRGADPGEGGSPRDGLRHRLARHVDGLDRHTDAADLSSPRSHVYDPVTRRRHGREGPDLPEAGPVRLLRHVRQQLDEPATAGEVPEQGQPVRADGGERGAVRCEPDPSDGRPVAVEAFDDTGGVHVPDDDRPVVTAGREA